MGYTLYVDESGDAGIKKVRGEGEQVGASPIMTMGGVLIPNDQRDTLRAELKELREEITKREYFHCQNMSHEEKIRLAQFLCKKDLQIIGVISAKITLRGYKAEIKENKDMYYNKCCQYLLERAGMIISRLKESPENTDIVLEEGSYDYAKLRGPIIRCQQSPIHQNTRFLKHISVSKIRSQAKRSDPLLELADLVAHALYRCVWGGKLNVTENRYLEEIRDKFFKDDDTGRALGRGLYVVHKPEDLKIAPQITNYLKAF